MKAPKIKLDKTGKTFVEGDFEFQLAEFLTIPFDGSDPFRKIAFGWNHSSPIELVEDNELYEIISEKLKQDFLKYLKSLKD